MNVTMWEHSSNDSHIFGHGKVYYCNSIIFTTFVQTVIQNCWDENIFLPTLQKKSPNKICTLHREFVKYMF
jgi:hypothetical protein